MALPSTIWAPKGPPGDQGPPGPAGPIGPPGPDGSTVDANLRAKFVVSKIKADGVTDDTVVLQAELNALLPGQTFLTPPGISIITHVICPSLDSVVFFFNGTKFLLKAGHDPLDNEMLRWNSLKNSYVYNFYTDGNSANVPDAPINSDVRYGRVLNWRLGDNSENVWFYNLGMFNAQYCGSQWGKNIRNIHVQGITYDMVGEHLFYISGTGGGNNKDLYFSGFRGGSLGVNPRNAVGNHECMLVKSFQTVGVNDNWVLEDGELAQAAVAGYAAVLLSSGDLKSAEVSNFKVGDNFTAILYPVAGTGNITLKNIKKLGTGTQPRLIYSHVSTATIGKLIGIDLDFTGTFTIDHVQLFDLLQDCTFPRIDTSASFIGEFNRLRSVVFLRCFFNRIGFLRYVEYDFIFEDCTYASPETGSTGSLDNIGNLLYTSGKWVFFIRPRFIGAHTYSLATQNPEMRLSIRDNVGPMKPVFGRASTTLARLVADGIEAVNGSNPFAGLTITSRQISKVVSADGARNWASYTNTWTIATGQTSIGFDLSGVLTVPFALTNVNVEPITSPSASGVTTHYITLVANTLTITVNAATLVPLQFAVSIIL